MPAPLLLSVFACPVHPECIERLAGAVPATVSAGGRSVESELPLAPVLDEAPGAVGFLSDAGFRRTWGDEVERTGGTWMYVGGERVW